MYHRILLFTLSACLFCTSIVLSQPQWVGDMMPDRSHVLLQQLSEFPPQLLSESSPEDTRHLQRQLFWIDEIFREFGEPGNKPVTVAMLKSEWNTARHFLASGSTGPMSDWQRGALEFIAGSFGQAAKAFQKIPAGGSKLSSSAQLWAGWSHIKAYHNPATALADLVEARQKRIDSSTTMKPDELIDLLWAHYLLQNDEKVQQLATSLYSGLAEDPRLFFVYALSLIRVGKLEEAHGSLARAINLGSNHPQVSQIFVSVCLQLGRNSEAVQEQMSSDHLWGEGQASISAPVDWYSCTPSQILERGGVDRSPGRLVQAAKLLEAVPDPFSALSLEAKGDLAWSQKQATEAADLYRQASDADPLLMNSRLKRILVLLEQRHFSAAFAEYFRMAEWSLLPQGYHAMARIRARFPALSQGLGDLFALSLYEALKETSYDSSDSIPYRTAAAITFSLFHFDRAVRYAAKAQQMGADDPELKTLLHVSRFREAESAQRPLKEAEIQNLLDGLSPIAEKTSSPLVEFVCARLNEARSRQEPANLHWQRALAEKGEDPVVLFANVQIALNKKNENLARSLLERLFRREFETNTAAVARRRYISLTRTGTEKETER